MPHTRYILLLVAICLTLFCSSRITGQDSTPTREYPTPSRPLPSTTPDFSSTAIPPNPYLPIVPTVDLNRTILAIGPVAWNPSPNGNLIALSENFRYSSNSMIGSPAISIRDTRNMSMVLELFPNKRGEPNLISALTWNPEGHYLAASMIDGTIIIWNVNDPSRPAGELITTLQNNFQNRRGDIYSRSKNIKWSPDGRWFASVGNDQSIHLWNVQNNYSLLDSIQTKISDFGADVTWSPDSAWLAVGAGDEVNVFKVSEKGHFVPTDSYKLESPQDTFGFVTDLVWNPSGSQLAFLDTQLATLYIYDTSTHLSIRKLATYGYPSSLIWSSNSSYFIYSNRYVIDSETGQVLKSYLPPLHIYLNIHLSEESNTLIALSYAFDEAVGATELKIVAPLDDSVNFVRPTSTPTPVGTPVSLMTRVDVIALSPNAQSHLLAVSGVSHSPNYSVIKFFLRVENTDDMSVVLDLIPLEKAERSQIISATWSPDGKYLASATGDGMVTIWNIADPTQPAGKVVRRFNTSTDDLWDIGWSPDGKWFATTTEDLIRMWDVNHNFTLVDTTYGGFLFTWSPDSQRIFIHNSIVNVSSGGQFNNKKSLLPDDVENVTNPVMNSAGTQIAFIDDQTQMIRVYDLQTNTDIRQVALPKLTEGYYGTLAWSPDGKYFAYSDENQNVRVIDSTTGEEFGNYPTESLGGLRTILWTADSKHIVFTGSKEASAMVTVSDKNSTQSTQKILILQDMPN